MRTVMSLLLGVATAFAGCASSPPPSPSPPPASPVVANAVPAAPAAASAPAGDATAKKATIPYGYKRTVVNGTEIFCRNDLITGSRTERHQVCYTKTQLENMQNNTQDYINSVQRSGGEAIKTCTAGPGCN